MIASGAFSSEKSPYRLNWIAWLGKGCGELSVHGTSTTSVMLPEPVTRRTASDQIINAWVRGRTPAAEGRAAGRARTPRFALEPAATHNVLLMAGGQRA